MYSNTTATSIRLSVCLLAFVAPRAGWADFCIGNGCGANDPTFHCHTRNTLGVECWDQRDNACEAVAGFARSEAFSCQQAVAGAPFAGVGGQLPTAVGGLNIFQSQIRKLAVSRRAQATTNDPATPQEDSEDDDGAVHHSTITAFYEHENWDLRGVEGDTDGVRFGWQRDTDSGGILAATTSYQEAEPDFGESIDVLNASFHAGHSFGPSEIWKWSAGVTISDISGLAEETLYGGGGQLYFHKDFAAGSVLSGGVIAQYQIADNLDDDLQTVSYGLAYGVPVAQRLSLDFEAFGVNIVQPDLFDDSFYTLAAMLSVYLTDRFSLTLGYRVLEGIDDLDSETITVGTSSRW